MATFRLLASTCDSGPCPTFYIDDETGDVLVQGYVTTKRPPGPLPVGENVLWINKAAWEKLLSQLPPR